MERLTRSETSGCAEKPCNLTVMIFQVQGIKMDERLHPQTNLKVINPLTVLLCLLE